MTSLFSTYAWIGLLAAAGCAKPQDAAAPTTRREAAPPDATPATFAVMNRSEVQVAEAASPPSPPPLPSPAVHPEWTLQDWLAAAMEPGGASAPLAHEDAMRLFPSKYPSDPSQMTALSAFGDLDDDGRDELLVEIAEGWHGRWLHDAVFRGDAAHGWTLIAQARRDQRANAPGALEVLQAGTRRFLIASGGDGGGTSLICSYRAALERNGDRLDQVMVWLSYLEFAGWGTGMWAEGSADDLVATIQPDGSLLLEHVFNLTLGIDQEIAGEKDVPIRIPIRYLQAEPGTRAVLLEPAGWDDNHYEVFLPMGARAWLVENEALAWQVTREGEPTERDALLRLAKIAMPDPRAAPLVTELTRQSAESAPQAD